MNAMAYVCSDNMENGMADKNKTLAVTLVYPPHPGAAQQEPIRYSPDGRMVMTPKDWQRVRFAIDLLLVSLACWIIIKLLNTIL